MLSVRALERPGLVACSFEIAAGDCVALTGPSGSGKTLLLRAIADLDPNQGEVDLDGAARSGQPAPGWRRQVAYVPAEPGWWADRVGEHFDDWEAALPLVERLGLPAECRDWPVQRLSTGERQRLGLARALAQAPRVLLLDEPTSGLDEAATAAVEALVAERLAAGAAVLWVSHDRAQAKRVARRRLEIAGGVLGEAAP